MKNCKNCNQLFQESLIRKFYCSVKCCNIDMNNHRKNGISISCSKCGKLTYYSQSQIKQNRKYFCSRNCRKQQNNFGCHMCKQIFSVRTYRVKNGKVKYCSRSCLGKDLLKKYPSIFGFKKLNKPFHRYKTITIKGHQYREHRYIMEQHLKRKLESWEHVHHINDNSLDNRIENLIVLSNADHQKEEYKLRIKLTSDASLV